MKWIPRQKIWLAIVVITNLALWVIPSDVVEQIARDRHTLLGRYSRGHFTTILVVGLISVVSFYIDWSTGPAYKRRRLQVLAVLFMLVPSMIVIDYLSRSPAAAHYVRDGLAYHRPVNSEFEVVFEDKPKAARSFPGAPPGYGSIRCVGRTDGRGYRNAATLESCDVVVLGDSFAEGSSVSDEHPWPVLLAQLGGLSVCNLGMSGYDPLLYLAALKEHGPALRPKYVLCMLYEGNDFRSAKSDRKRKNPSFSKRLNRYFKQSPIVNAVDRGIIETFGPINRDGAVGGVEILDWLPLAIPEGPSANHYAFEPKQLRDLYQDPKAFSLDRHWLNSRRQLTAMKAWCDEAGARFVLVYAPTKAHVMLPLVGDGLPADHVLAFTALQYKGELPDAATFLGDLLGRVEGRESVVAAWCGRESVAFVSTTEPLRAAAAAGRQVYFTYDQHWTPEGHETVARAVNALLAAESSSRDGA